MEPETSMPSLVERVGTTGFLQVQADGFKDLALKDKVLAHRLSMAAIAIHPVVFDQNSPYGLRTKHLLEHSGGFQDGNSSWFHRGAQEGQLYRGLDA